MRCEEGEEEEEEVECPEGTDDMMGRECGYNEPFSARNGPSFTRPRGRGRGSFSPRGHMGRPFGFRMRPMMGPRSFGGPGFFRGPSRFRGPRGGFGTQGPRPSRPFGPRSMNGPRPMNGPGPFNGPGPMNGPGPFNGPGPMNGPGPFNGPGSHGEFENLGENEFLAGTGSEVGDNNNKEEGPCNQNMRFISPGSQRGKFGGHSDNINSKHGSRGGPHRGRNWQNNKQQNEQHNMQSPQKPSGMHQHQKEGEPFSEWRSCDTENEFSNVETTSDSLIKTEDKGDVIAIRNRSIHADTLW